MNSVARSHVVTPSVAFYGSLFLDETISPQRNLVVACNAFLARATFHGAVLYVPMVFYSQVAQVAFTVHQKGNLTAEDCFVLTKVILEMLFETPNAVFGDADYLAVARQFGCPIITTSIHPFETNAPIQILEVQDHPWASTGGLEDFPPQP